MRKFGLLMAFALGAGLASPAQGQLTVTSGSGATLHTISFDANGSLEWFEAPATVTPIDTNSVEGYGVCSDYTGSSAPHGFTLRGIVDVGWSSATVSQPGGPNTYPVSYTRSSVDGAVELTQEFTGLVGYRALNIVMKVKNLTGSTIPNMKISRFFGITVLNPIFWDNTFDGVNARLEAPAPLLGFQATNNTKTFTLTASTELYTAFSGGCDANQAIAAQPVGVQTGGVGRMDYNVGSLSPGQTKIVRFQYRRY